MKLWGVTVLTLCGIVLLSACGASESPEPDRSAALDRARSFGEYPLYYAGDSFEALPLTHAALGPGSGTRLRRAWSFIYGDCTPSGDGGCAPPLEVQNWSICTRFPALYPGSTPETTPMHGAQTLPAGGGLDVYTGRTTVVIFGVANKLGVLRALRRVSDDVVPETLPPPAPGALEGKLPCQARSLRKVSR